MPFDSLPPWDANTFFDLPTGTAVVLGATVGKIVSSNPMRVGLFIASLPAGSVSLSPNEAPATSSLGIVLTGTSQPLSFIHADWGPLVQSEWWGIGSAAAAGAFVIELVLNKWPKRRKKVWNATKALSGPKGSVGWPYGFAPRRTKLDPRWYPDFGS